ncbi:MAG: hypothetical protein AAF280_11075 [Pseudomonadota bacterium]
MELPDTWVGPAIIAAVIAAMVNVVGFLLSGRRQRQSERRRRREKRVDIQTALKAEIDHYVATLSNDKMNLDEFWKDIVLRMEQDPAYIPFIPAEKNDMVFQSVLQDISILPGPVVEPVTYYYNQVVAISALIEDLRSPDFRNTDPARGPVMTQDQRIAIFTDYIGLKNEALEAGRKVSFALQKSLEKWG